MWDRKGRTTGPSVGHSGGGRLSSRSALLLALLAVCGMTVLPQVAAASPRVAASGARVASGDIANAAQPAVAPAVVRTRAGAVSPAAIGAGTGTMTPVMGLEGIPHFSHVWIIILENKSQDEIWYPGYLSATNTISGAMPVTTAAYNTPNPYLNSLVPQGGFIRNYYGDGHLSFDNYLSLTAGQTPNGATQDDCPNYASCLAYERLTSPSVPGSTVPGGPNGGYSIADQLETNGNTWKAYMDSMPAPCTHADPNSLTMTDPYQGGNALGNYADRHDPFVYYPPIVDNQARCAAHVVPYTDTVSGFATDMANHTVPDYSFITPDTCHDGHDVPTCFGGAPGKGGLIAADSWLSSNVPPILNSPEYKQGGALFIVWDESDIRTDTVAHSTADNSTCCAGGDSADGTPPGGGLIGALALSPYIRPGLVTTTSYDHNSLLRTIEDSFGIGSYIGDAGSILEHPMTDLFTTTGAMSATTPTPAASPSTTATMATATMTTTGTASATATAPTGTPTGAILTTVAPTLTSVGSTATTAATPSATGTATPSATGTATPSATGTATGTGTVATTPSASASATGTILPTVTISVPLTLMPTLTNVPATGTATPVTTATSTPTTALSTPSAMVSATTAISTPTSSNTPLPTPTRTANTATVTANTTATAVASPSTPPTATPTGLNTTPPTSTGTATATPINTGVGASTPTPTSTPTSTPTGTTPPGATSTTAPTVAPMVTNSPTASPTAAATATATGSNTAIAVTPAPLTETATTIASPVPTPAHRRHRPSPAHPVVTARIVLNQRLVSPGNPVIVAGVGFGRRERVALSLDGVALLTSPAVVTTDGRGAFSATFIVPSSLLAGDNTVGAIGTRGRASVTASLLGVLTAGPQYYFAGAPEDAANGTHSTLTLLNPNTQSAAVQLDVYYANGAVETENVTVGATGERLVALAGLAGRAVPRPGVTGPGRTLGVTIEANRPIVAQIDVTRRGRDGSLLLGNAGLATRWYLAEGYTGLTFHETVSLLNPDVTHAARVTLHLLPAGGRAGRAFTVVVPKHTNQVVDINRAMPGRAVGLVVTSDRPVAVERTLTFAHMRARSSPGARLRAPRNGATGYGQTTRAGTTVAATSWLFAEGATVNHFETYLTVLNPGARAARVSVSFFGRGGALLAGRTLRVAPLSRATLSVNRVLQATHVASVVMSDQPVVVERPEYFGSPNGVAVPGSDVFGRNGTGVKWSFPGGDMSGKNEFFLLYNPSPAAVPVNVTFYDVNDRSATRRVIIPARARYTLNVGGLALGLSAINGAVLQSTNGQGFVAEQTVFAPDHSSLQSTEGLAR